MSSILTNTGAMVALQTLKGINSDLNKTQNEISTGKTVDTSKDNAAIWAISKVMDSDVSSFETISSNLSLGSSTVAVARDAAEQITDLLDEIKTKIVGAQGENVDRSKIQTEIDALVDQIDSVVSAAQFNGLNMIDGSATTDVEILASLDRDAAQTVTASNITVQRIDLSTTTGALSALTTIDVATDTASANAALGAIDALIDSAVDAAAAFGSAESRIETQNDFVNSLIDSLKTGIGSLVDADMEEASARLQALQTQQQLGIQALSIANQAPQNILALFQ